MASGIVSDCDGFLTFTEEELAEIERETGATLTFTRSLPKTFAAPGVAGCSISTHQYGKNFDGYWDNDKIMQHVKEFLFCAEMWEVYRR